MKKTFFIIILMVSCALNAQIKKATGVDYCEKYDDYVVYKNIVSGIAPVDYGKVLGCEIASNCEQSFTGLSLDTTYNPAILFIEKFISINGKIKKEFSEISFQKEETEKIKNLTPGFYILHSIDGLIWPIQISIDKDEVRFLIPMKFDGGLDILKDFFSKNYFIVSKKQWGRIYQE